MKTATSEIHYTPLLHNNFANCYGNNGRLEPEYVIHYVFSCVMCNLMCDYWYLYLLTQVFTRRTFFTSGDR